MHESGRYFVSHMCMLRLQDTAGWLPMIAKILALSIDHVIKTRKSFIVDK